MALHPYRKSWLFAHTRLLALFTLAIFALGPGLGVSLAIHLCQHSDSHCQTEACCSSQNRAGDHEDPSRDHNERSHDSSTCLICVQLTTNAKSPTIQITSLLFASDGAAEVVDVSDDQFYSTRGFSVGSPRSPPLT